MRQRIEKLLIGLVVVALAYGVAAIVVGYDAGLCKEVEAAIPAGMSGNHIFAAALSLCVAFYLLIDAYLPIREGALDRIRRQAQRAHDYLLIDGESSNYWHLRVAIAVFAVITIQLVTEAMEYLHAG